MKKLIMGIVVLGLALTACTKVEERIISPLFKS